MATDMNGHFHAKLLRDGEAKPFADAQIEAPNRERATSMATEWALGEMPNGLTAATSLFLKIGDVEWLVKRWGDL